MSSFYSYDVSFPKDTELSKWNNVHDRVKPIGDNRLGYHLEGFDMSSEEFLSDLVELLGSKPLTDVPGLRLDAWLEVNDDGHWECKVDIEDGKLKLWETEIVWKETTLDEVPIDIGSELPYKANSMISQLCRYGVNDEGRFDEKFWCYDIGFVNEGQSLMETVRKIAKSCRMTDSQVLARIMAQLSRKE